MRGWGPNDSSTVAMVTSLTTTVAVEMSSTAEEGNVSLVWQQAEVLSISERARVVLSQPVAVISLTLCLLSLLANFLSILATLLGPNGLVTHLKLVVSLGLSDMLLSFSTVSDTLNRIFNASPTMSTPPDQRLAFACASTFHFALRTMAIVISLLNLLVMALDHYVAIMNPLHYPTRLSRTTGNVIICCIWLVAFVTGCSVFFADVEEFHKVSRHFNYCEYVQYSDYQSEYLVFTVAFISFIVITYTYGRIYVEVRRTYRNGSTNPMDYVRNRKALLTTLLIIGTFVFCWLPTCLFQIALVIQVHVDKVVVKRMYVAFLRANRYLNALLLLNSLCDPIIYAFRLRDVQLGYRKLFQRCFFNCTHKQQSHSFRSSMMRQTQTALLPTMDNLHAHSGVHESDSLSVCNKLPSFCCDDLVKEEHDLVEVTPMIACVASHAALNGSCEIHRDLTEERGLAEKEDDVILSEAGKVSSSLLNKTGNGEVCSRNQSSNV
ncbi:adrenocorticotropic hormone receptor-like [Littorina saxatilis]|uniref:adrenocorticotropic hormone receptor-like n=1 Tax=Littorina saxatilis TaxID=31220 RepID=UPI0038B5C022